MHEENTADSTIRANGRDSLPAAEGSDGQLRAEECCRQPLTLAVYQRAMNPLPLEVLRDNARSLGNRMLREEARHVGDRRVVHQPRDTFEEPRNERSREAPAHLVPVVAHEQPDEGAVLSVAQRALDHERAVLRPHLV